ASPVCGARLGRPRQHRGKRMPDALSLGDFHALVRRFCAPSDGDLDAVIVEAHDRDAMAVAVSTAQYSNIPFRVIMPDDWTRGPRRAIILLRSDGDREPPAWSRFAALAREVARAVAGRARMGYDRGSVADQNAGVRCFTEWLYKRTGAEMSQHLTSAI